MHSGVRNFWFNQEWRFENKNDKGDGRLVRSKEWKRVVGGWGVRVVDTLESTH